MQIFRSFRGQICFEIQNSLFLQESFSSCFSPLGHILQQNQGTPFEKLKDNFEVVSQAEPALLLLQATYNNLLSYEMMIKPRDYYDFLFKSLEEEFKFQFL